MSQRYKQEGTSESEGKSQHKQEGYPQTLDRVDSEKLRLIENQRKKIKYAQKLGTVTVNQVQLLAKWL